MSLSQSVWVVRWRFSAWILTLLGCAGFFGPLAEISSAAIDQRSTPPLSYHAAVEFYYEGEYRDALRQFEDEWRGAIKTPQSRWIDSICYHTMMGECYYQMGRLDDALKHYTSAVRLYLTFPDWMIRVQPVPIQPWNKTTMAPWGTSSRKTRLGRFPSSMLISQGRIDNNAPFRQGGVVQQAVLFPLNVTEIVRMTTLAIRRRTELLGPLTKHDPITSELIAALSRRPGPPNHWTQCWIDVQLGLALVAGGKDVEAIPLLSRGSVAGGQYDHPLTATALFSLGRLALARADYPSALNFFHDASIAAFHYGDAAMLEEAFRWGATTHLAANRKGIFPPLAVAADWAKVKRLQQLRASLLLSAAENLLVLTQTPQASVMLEEAAKSIAKRTMGDGRIGARLHYLRAFAFFQQRNPTLGDQSLDIAMRYMRTGSVWLHRILEIDRRFIAGEVNARGPITPRTAMTLYTQLLRDPSPVDWTLQPMESLSVLVTPHVESLEHWFLIAMSRKEHERALEIADRARRHRFFSTLAFGGRLQSLRWILEAPKESLRPEALLQRQGLVASYPAYDQLSRQASEVRSSLKQMPLVSGDEVAFQKQRKILENLSAISLQQEAVLREIVVRREPASLVFPPMKTTGEIQDGLPKGHVLLAFFVAKGDLYGFLMNRDKYSHWQVKAGPMLSKKLVHCLQAMGHHDGNRELTLKNLSDNTWKKLAAELLSGLLEGSQADFRAEFPELVIVPDGLLWYVPFESLQVKVDGAFRPLISRFRIRYAPTASLAVPSGPGRNPVGQTAVILGHLFPRDDDAVAQEAFQNLSRVVPRAVAINKPPLPGPSSAYASLFDQLIVLDDLQIDPSSPYGWAPFAIDKKKPGNTLGDWLTLPWQGPSVVILPGFHTASENGLKKVDRTGPGREIFLSVCGLMSSGTRTLLLSRWRTGGESSQSMVREFAQELPFTSPADAWQRAVLLTASTRLNLDAEPRVKQVNVEEAPKGNHPFFWSGYLLIDSGQRDVPGPISSKPPPLKLQPAEKK